MRAHVWLRLLLVAAMVAVPASLPVSAAANSAFDQYVEVPPDSGSQNNGNGAVNPGSGPGNTGGPGNAGVGSSGSGQASTTDPMVAWATGQAPAEPTGSGAADGTASPSNNSNGSSGSSGGEAQRGASLIEASGSLDALTSDESAGPMLLIVAMILSALAVGGFAVYRKRQHN